MNAEELAFYQSLGPTVAKKKASLTTAEKLVAERLFSRGLIDRIKRSNRIYYQPLKDG